MVHHKISLIKGSLAVLWTGVREPERSHFHTYWMSKRKKWCHRAPRRVEALIEALGMENIFPARTIPPNKRVRMLSPASASHRANTNGKLIQLEQPPGEQKDSGQLVWRVQMAKTSTADESTPSSLGAKEDYRDAGKSRHQKKHTFPQTGNHRRVQARAE